MGPLRNSAAWLLVLLAAAVCHEAAAGRVVPEQQSLEQLPVTQQEEPSSHNRKLQTAAQGYTIGVGDTSGDLGIAVQQNVEDLLIAAINAGLPKKGVNANTAQAGTVRNIFIGDFATNFADNGQYGGAAKQTVDYRAKSDQSNAVSSGASDDRSISHPGVGVTSSGAFQFGISLLEKVLDPGVQAGSGNTTNGDNGEGSEGFGVTGSKAANSSGPAVIQATRGSGAQLRQEGDGSGGDDGRACPACLRPPTGLLGGAGDYYYSRDGPTYDILMSANAHYAISGDYIYTGDTQDYDIGLGKARRVYDYDYGQLRPIPEATINTGRVRTVGNDELGRTGGYGRAKSEATIPAGLSKHKTVTGSVYGQVGVLNQNDEFGKTSLTTGINPVRQASAASAGFTAGRNFKFSQPSDTISTGHAGTVASRNYLAGATADTLNYGSSTKSTTMRSQVISANGVEQVNIIPG